MILSLVVAASENYAIGKQNKLLWHLPNDLRFLKNITWGMPVAMGRKTFESVDSKPLKGRVNIIITRQGNFEAPGAVVVNSLNDAIFFAKENWYNELMVLGGAEIYAGAMPKANRIYLTRVHAFFEDADAFFPEIDEKKWVCTKKQDFEEDDKHKYAYSFEVWEKK
jgi:dihydrofolate reductase